MEMKIGSLHSSLVGSFASSPKAHALASSCLLESSNFIRQLNYFVDSFYAELVNSSGASGEEAWSLTASLVRAVFKELRRVRVVAEDPSTTLTPSELCATYIWGLLQAHRVMKSFMDHSFRHHPCLASVVNLHVFKTRVPQSTFLSLQREFASQKKVIADLQSAVDRLRNKVGGGGGGGAGKEKGGKKNKGGKEDDDQD